MPDRAPSGAWLTRQLRRAEKHAEAVEPLLAAALEDVLTDIGEQAARRFTARATSLTAAATPGVKASSTMVCLKPTPEQQAGLHLGDVAGTTVDVENIHLTLCYLGDTIGPLGPIVDALRPVSLAHAALSGLVGGYGVFSDLGDGYPLIGLPDVPGLVELRVAVTEALASSGIDYARNHGYCPHLTLGYFPTVPALNGLEPHSVTFGALYIVRGDTEVVPLPLSGRPPVTAGAHVYDALLPDVDPAGGGDWFPVTSINGAPLPAQDGPIVIRAGRAAPAGFDFSGGRCEGKSSWGSRCSFPAGHSGLHHGVLDPYWEKGESPADFHVRADERAMLAKSPDGDVVEKIREVAEAHRPEEPQYGHVAWHAASGTVFWQSWDGTGRDEWDAAEAAFLAIDGVNEVIGEAEAALPEGDGWEQVYSTVRWPLHPDLYQTFGRGDPPAFIPPGADEIVDADEIVGRIMARIKPVRDAAIRAVTQPAAEAIGVLPITERVTEEDAYAALRAEAKAMVRVPGPHQGVQLIQSAVRHFDPLDPAQRLHIIRDDEGALKAAYQYSILADRVGDGEIGSLVRGGGTALMQQGARDAVEHGLPLDVAYAPSSKGFYEKLGFEPYGGAGHMRLTDERLDALATKERIPDAPRLSSSETIGLGFDTTNPLIDAVMQQTGSQVVEIADTTRLNVMRIVRASYQEGLSIPHTAAAIREGMADASTARATLIARTELAGAVNGASLAAVRTVERATGTTYHKVWMTAPGAKTPRHYLYDGLNGQSRKLEAEFDVGGYSLQHPGDPDGPPGEVCNCRCALRYDDGAAPAAV